MKNIQNDLRDLSYCVLSLHDGADEAWAWRRELQKRQTLFYAWQTELVNPKYMPDWVILKDAKLEYEIPWNLRRWVEFRESEWKRKTESQIVIDGQIFYSNYNTHPKLVKVPTQKNTRELFTSIVKTIPPPIYDWCEIFERLSHPFKDDRIFLIDRTSGLTILPGALEFVIARCSSHTTRHQNSMSTIGDIKSPLPEIEAYENQFDRDRNRSTLKYSHQSDYSPISLIEAWDKYQREFNRRVQETEDEIAAENSRSDEEFQNAQQEESAS